MGAAAAAGAVPRLLRDLLLPSSICCAQSLLVLSLSNRSQTAGYYFDTYSGNASGPACNSLFCPLYSLGASPDPLLDDAPKGSNLFLAVGLDSGE